MACLITIGTSVGCDIEEEKRLEKIKFREERLKQLLDNRL